MDRFSTPLTPASLRFTTATPKMARLVFAIAVVAMPAAASAQKHDGDGGKIGESKPDKRAVERGAKKLEAEQLEPLARYVPNDAGIYFRISDHEKWRALLGRVGAFAELPDSKIQALLVGQPRVIAMQSWRQRGREMIAVCRPNDAEAFAGALEIKSAELVREDGKVKVYHGSRGLWIATDGEVFVLSDVGSGSAMFEQSARMLAGHERASLLDHRRFCDDVRWADPQASGLLFIQRRPAEDDRRLQFRPAALPHLQTGCIQIHLEPDRVRCLFRGLRSARELPYQQVLRVDQLQLLPPSTIAVWVLPVDMASIVEFGVRYLPRSGPSFYRQLARTVETYGLHGIMPLSELGPRATWCMLAGGQSEDALRLAYITEAKQASQAVATLSRICESIAGIINTHQAAASHEIALESSTYHDHAITTLRVTRLIGAEPGGGLWSDFQPSITAIGNHLVVGSDPSVVKEIIDASRNGTYALPEFQRWATASETPGRETQVRGWLSPRRIAAQLAALQPLLLADDSELLRSEWFQNLRDYFQATPVRLGVRLRKDNSQTPGKVYVMRALEGRPADGKLRPGDYIVGIDGEFLSLESPKEDLRHKLQARPGGGVRTLRIERHGRVSDVEIYLPKPSPQSLRGLLVGTGNAIQLLADLGNVVENITYRQFGTKPFELQAEIILELRAADSND
ncbi:MAG: hypothetical protein IIB58_02950 [Planctomycetes bacterium]|nr:hypothetical protein [Planctomycetota bacterium]